MEISLNLLFVSIASILVSTASGIASHMKSVSFTVSNKSISLNASTEPISPTAHTNP